MNCPKCNAPLDPNQRFCGSCGAPVTPSAPHTQPKDYLDVNRTMAADPDEYEPNNSNQEPYQPEQSYQEPYQPEQSYQEPYQPEQSYQEPYQPEQSFQKPYQPGQSYQEPYQPEQNYQESSQPEQGYSDTRAPYSSDRTGQYDEQFRTYQQPSQFGHTDNSYSYQQSGGVMVQNKANKKTIIIIVAVAAVLAITGIVLGIVFGVRSCKKSNSSNSRLTSNSGTFIVQDSAINTGDKDTEAKINAFLNNHNVSRSYSGSDGEMTMEVHGNTILTLCKVPAGTTDADLAQLKTQMQATTADMANEKSIIGVDSLVEVTAVLRDNGSVYYAKVAK